MWGLVRIILLIGNATLIALLVRQGINAGRPPRSDEVLPFFGVAAFLVLKSNQPSNWRIFRLIGLWFDAKESELRQRVDRSRQDK
jgi:hypothetical protein